MPAAVCVCFNVLVLNQPLTILICLIAFAASPLLTAAEPIDKASPYENVDGRKDDRGKLSPGDRDSKAKEGRRTNGAPSRADSEKRREQLKNMTPEERAAKRKEIQERLEKRIAELRVKQTNATITLQESRELARREQILKRFEAESAAAAHAKPVLTNSPAQH